MTTWWDMATRWRDERNRIAELNYKIEEIEKSYEPHLAATKAEDEVAYVGTMMEMRDEIEPYRDEIDLIRTNKALRTAVRFGIVTPLRDEAETFWRWSRAYNKSLLTVEGHQLLRREFALESELSYRPILSWGAFGISLISLAVAMLKG